MDAGSAGSAGSSARLKAVDSDAEASDFRSALRELRELVESPGWRVVAGGLQQQMDAITRDIVLTPTKDSVELEFSKGKVNGLLAAMQYPQALIDMYSEMLKKEINDGGSE